MNEDQGVITEDVQLPEESPTTNQTPEEVPQSEEQGAPETQTRDTETGESGKGANQRIRELNQRAKSAEEENRSLKQKIAELTTSVGVPSFNEAQFNPQEPIVQDGEELSAAELNRRVAARDQRVIQQAVAQAQLSQRQSEAIARHNSESEAVLQKYAQLDPDSDSFDKELSDTVTEAVEAHVRANPYSASVSKFVDRLMKPYKRAVDKEVGQVTEKIAKQVSETTLRPTSIRKQEKSATEKSVEELEQELGIVHV